jgi:hypothetical protein
VSRYYDSAPEVDMVHAIALTPLEQAQADIATLHIQLQRVTANLEQERRDHERTRKALQYVTDSLRVR